MAAAFRIYPVCCTSACCGRSRCDGCSNLPIKQDFDRWREEHAAIKPDPTWCPTYWEATR